MNRFIEEKSVKEELNSKEKQFVKVEHSIDTLEINDSRREITTETKKKKKSKKDKDKKKEKSNKKEKEKKKKQRKSTS